MKKNILLFTICTLTILISASLCLAEEPIEPEKPAFSLRATGKYIDNADVGDNDGSMSVTTGRVDMQWKFLSLSYAQSRYSWDNVNALSFGNGSDDPWDQLHRLSLGINHRDALADDWFYDVGAVLTSSFEKEMADSYGGVIRGGLGYSISETTKVMGGLAFMTNNIRTTIMPTIGLSYEGLDESGAGFTGFLGVPTSNIKYQFDKSLGLRASIDKNGQTARLADDSVVAEKGYVSLSDWQTGLYLDWNPTELTNISIGPEYSFGRTLTTYSKTGDKLADEDVDAALGGALRFRVRF